LYYSFLPGFSFGSWVFLVVTVAADDTALAVVMSLSRLLHFAGGILISAMLFGDEGFGARLSRLSDYMKRVADLRKHVDGVFARENLYIVEMVSLLSLCDVTMFRFIPWTRSEFFKLSEGFPSMSIMNLCLTIKIVETTISVVCDVIYLTFYGDSDSVTRVQEQQTQALFVLNIIFGVATAVMDLLVLCVRRGVLAELKEEASPSSGSTTESGGGDDGDGGDVGSEAESGGLEMWDVYRNRDGDGDISGDAIPTAANPMHAAALEQREKELEASKATIEELKATIDAQDKKIEQLGQQLEQQQPVENL
jgi:hypothetical protein